MRKKSNLMRVSEDLEKTLKRIAKQNNINITEASRDVAKTIDLMNGKKKLRKKLMEEVSF